MGLPLDSIATIFIFLIGLPAILLQTLPAEIRRTVLQARTQVAVFTTGPIIIASVVVILGVYLTLPVGPIEQPPPAGLDARNELIWLVLMAVLLLVCSTAALLFIEYSRRQTVIKRLAKAAGRGIPLQGRPIERVLRALIDLGIQSQGGEDKGLVIEALVQLTEATQYRPGYDGAQLEEVIKGFEDIFTSGAYFGSPDNFSSSAEWLRGLIQNSCEKRHSDDLKAAIQTASRLGRASLGHEESVIQLRFLDALFSAGAGGDPGCATWASRALFEIGSQAVESDLTLVAIASLSKLETLVMQHSPVQGELASDFIGLLAHFWARQETGRDYSRRFLEQDAELFAEPLPQVIRRAREDCIQSARFQTGDYLQRMLTDLDGEPK